MPILHTTQPDTGWVILINNGLPTSPSLTLDGPPLTAGRFRVKRTPGLVWWSLDDLQWSAGGTWRIIGFPPAFQLSGGNSTYPGAFYNLYNPAVPIRTDTAAPTLFIGSGGARVRDLRCYPCDRPWPVPPYV